MYLPFQFCCSLLYANDRFYVFTIPYLYKSYRQGVMCPTLRPLTQSQGGSYKTEVLKRNVSQPSTIQRSIIWCYLIAQKNQQLRLSKVMSAKKCQIQIFSYNLLDYSCWCKQSKTNYEIGSITEWPHSLPPITSA